MDSSLIFTSSFSPSSIEAIQFKIRLMVSSGDYVFLQKAGKFTLGEAVAWGSLLKRRKHSL
jgi:hypothetical protein